MGPELATAVESRRGSRQADYLAAAAQLFAERGYAGTSVDDVGNRLGVSGPAVYWHFASKEALLTEMLSDISDRLLAGGQRCVAAAADGRQALRNLVRWQVEFALDHPELITVHARDLAHVPGPARQRIRRTQRLYAELWVGALGGHRPRGPRDAPPGGHPCGDRPRQLHPLPGAELEPRVGGDALRRHGARRAVRRDRRRRRDGRRAQRTPTR